MQTSSDKSTTPPNTVKLPEKTRKVIAIKAASAAAGAAETQSIHKPVPRKSKSAFDEFGYKRTIENLHEEIQAIYLEDAVPWILGYSGGKDSTATLQLIWSAITKLPIGKRNKPVYVISTDTLVENPIVSAWVQRLRST